MPRYQIKVNVSGSWANLCSCPPDRLDAVKAACETLAAALDHGVAFEVSSRMLVAIFNSRRRGGQPHGWYAPVAIEDNPIQAGVDRTTSGAIGQP